MKKYLLALLCSVFIISCSKKEIILTGKVNNASPLGRVELIDVSSVATLPIANFGFDENGNFSDTLNIEKDGIYAMIYQGRANFIYLKKGQNLHITGNDSNFPQDLKFTGEGQGNNEFLMESQKFTDEYLSKIDVKTLLTKDETGFSKEIEKFATDINKKFDEISKTKKADSHIVQWKKDDVLVNFLMLSYQYEQMHGELTQNPSFKVSEKFKETRKKFEKDSYIKEYPIYRQYLVTKLQNDFEKFAKTHSEKNTETTYTEVFLKFLDTRKELSQETKDYLASFIATQIDFNPQNLKAEQVMKAIQEKVKTESVKKELEKVFNTIIGLKVGTAVPEIALVKQDGKTAKLSDFKGKPTLLVFYSSFAPGMVENIAPTLKELNTFYKDKLNFVYINLDDNAKQFQSTSKSLLKGFSGTNLYAKGGLKSELAKQFYIYGFKLPSFVILDKEGKVAGKYSRELISSEFLEILYKQTGIKIPIEPEVPEHYEGDGHEH